VKVRDLAIGLAVLGVFGLFSCEAKKRETSSEKVSGGAYEKYKASEAFRISDQKGCLACHDIEKRRVGPPFIDIANRYREKEGALDELIESITKGSMGKWGSIPMTPQPVTKEEARKISEWILELK